MCEAMIDRMSSGLLPQTRRERDGGRVRREALSWPEQQGESVRGPGRIASVHIHLDPVGGVAGDMFAAALLDAFPERVDALGASLAQSRLHEIVKVWSEPFTDGILRGRRFRTEPAPGLDGDETSHHAHDHGRGHHHHHDHESHVHPGATGSGAAESSSHRGTDRHSEHAGGTGHHAHSHRRFADIRAWLGGSGLDARVAERSDAIFTVLAEAEAEVHGIEVADVTFHEVGAWDSIADVVCAAWLIDSLAPASWSCAPLPLGGGQVRTAHGVLPVPAPATALLLRGFPAVHDGVEGERVTPTGAAVLRHLEPDFDRSGIAGRIVRTGHGFGSRRLPGMSNVLRTLVLESVHHEHSGWREETIAVCSFEVDDQTPEDLAVGLDRLRASEGVLDVLQTPVFGKKGRMATSVRVLARPEARERVIERCFAETTTLGVRWATERRAALEREERAAAVDGGKVRVKRARRPSDQVTMKAEMDDIASADGDRAAREERRRRAEST